ncbi:GNAT family N-acetyltransferase [Lactiplantibacillus sp. WILCCON 0030]|uniref:GNAT family N-acetyltransferase n=1 Tax=Lactiplantibacillus brownii TaxID=3069269 RepID=A0ABU1A8C4_9LACO|nr:GNAT family N-acetyltransferase [Lactiplantibacillus brownii]MDQ7937152.1 GNAT family N-acetyltransferase [Lactiplantibacillus brownii]
MKFESYQFDDLTPRQIYEIYHLRVAIFVVEQSCAYQEVDETDLSARHLLGTDANGQLVAYARLMQEPQQQARFGRIIVRKTARGAGNGQALIRAAIHQIRCLWPATTQINIQAQHYLDRFYRSFGFVPVSAVYLEDGIPHQDMILKIND